MGVTLKKKFVSKDFVVDNRQVWRSLTRSTWKYRKAGAAGAAGRDAADLDAAGLSVSVSAGHGEQSDG